MFQVSQRDGLAPQGVDVLGFRAQWRDSPLGRAPDGTKNRELSPKDTVGDPSEPSTANVEKRRPPTETTAPGWLAKG